MRNTIPIIISTVFALSFILQLMIIATCKHSVKAFINKIYSKLSISFFLYSLQFKMSIVLVNCTEIKE